MINSLINVVSSGANLFKAAVPIGLKAFKYFIDDTFRDKVKPVPGSVLYCDLWVAVEHSGIYVDDSQISNIEVEGVAESSVNLCGPRSFTSKSKMGRKIYVSCNSDGAVGHHVVASRADSHVGERAFYGLIFKNCHQFSTKCVDYLEHNIAERSIVDNILSVIPGETWEPTLAVLKKTAHEKLGATKWRLWDWDDENVEEIPEPDWQTHINFYENQPLDSNSIEQIRVELRATQAYESEIEDEDIPEHIRHKLLAFKQTLDDISQKYEQVKEFLALCPGAGFSYAELKACKDDFNELANMLQSNLSIKELVSKMGRNYISEEKKKQTKVPQACRSEVYGTHRSDDIMRMLPSELLNLDDEVMESLFYARLLEKNLLSYELQGTAFVDGEKSEVNNQRTGPVVACLDTSGSMSGSPLLKAKALLLAVAKILKQEQRSLHLILFGSIGQVKEFSLNDQTGIPGLLSFLQQGYNGGTDFETPLIRAFEVIELHPEYKKADVLMITDGDCHLNESFSEFVVKQKQNCKCTIYSVLCAGGRVEDNFSDEVVVLSP